MADKKSCIAVIMAAGEGTRMRSALPKVLHKANGKELVRWVADAACDAMGTAPIIIYGSGGQLVPDTIKGPFEYVRQERRLGSGDAVKAAKDAIVRAGSDFVLVLAGDMPLIRAGSIRNMIDEAEAGDYDLLMMTGIVDEPKGYGRIVRDELGVEKIVEEKDADPETKKIKEVNLSVYCFKTQALLEALEQLRPNNAAGEYYITDCLAIIRGMGGRCGAVIAADISECMGVNDRIQLAKVSEELRKRKNEELMKSGVTLIDPVNTYIEDSVTVGRDTVIYPGTILAGKTEIGENCVLVSCRLKDVSVKGGMTVTETIWE